MRAMTERRRALISTIKEKLLLDPKWPFSTPGNTAYDKTTLRTFTPQTIVLKITRNNYYGTNSSITVLSDDSFRISGSNGYGAAFVTNLTPGGHYKLTCNISGTSSSNASNICVMYYDSDGTYSTSTLTWIDGNRKADGSIASSFWISRDYPVNLVFFAGNNVTFSNIKLVAL